jgi:hypothetical protein
VCLLDPRGTLETMIRRRVFELSEAEIPLLRFRGLRRLCWRSSVRMAAARPPCSRRWSGCSRPNPAKSSSARALGHYSSRERARLLAYVPQSHVATFAFTVKAVVLMGRTAHGSIFSRPTAGNLRATTIVPN